MSTYLERNAYLIAEFVHRNQTRNDGKLYISHPKAVGDWLKLNYLAEDAWMIISLAYLHDVFEDGNQEDITIAFKKWLLPEYVINYAKKLNKHNYKDYDDYIQHMKSDLVLACVKYSDINHNYPTAKEKNKLKYMNAMKELAQAFPVIGNWFNQTYGEI